MRQVSCELSYIRILYFTLLVWWQSEAAATRRASSAVGIRTTASRRVVHLVADVRTVCVTLPHQRQAVPFRRTALQPHLRVVEVQQQPAEYQLHARTRVGQSALPEERAVGVGRYV